MALNMKAIKDRLAAYDEALPYNVMDYPARGLFLLARQEIKSHAIEDIDALVKRVEELEADAAIKAQKLEHYVDETFNILNEDVDRVKVLEAIRTAAIVAFQHLAKDNTYAPGPNAAWKVLGEALGMVSSTDKPQ